jgi:hypothetical protein
MQGFATTEGMILRGERILLRFEVTKFLATGITIQAQCSSGVCVDIHGWVKCSRTYNDVHDAVANANFSYQISGEPTELMGLYYFEITYSQGQPDFFEFTVNFTEEMQGQNIKPDSDEFLQSKVLNYGALTSMYNYVTHEIGMYSTELVKEPIYVGLIPLDGYF